MVDTLIQLLPESFLPLALIILAALVLDYLNIKQKSSFSNWLYSDAPANTESHIDSYYNSIRSVFGAEKVHVFLLRSSLITLIAIAILFSVQRIVNPRAFEVVSEPFIESLLRLRVDSFFILIGVMAIDAISVYQTIFFIRIARYYRSFVEVPFLFYADIVLSVSIFIFIFPLIFCLVILASQPNSVVYNVLLYSRSLPEESSDYSLIRRFLAFDPEAYEAPDAPSKDGTEDRAPNQTVSRWVTLSFDVLASREPYQSLEALPLDEAFSRMRQGGSILVQAAGFPVAEQTLPIIADLMNASGLLQDVVSLESYSGLFSAYGLMRVSAHYSSGYKNLSKDYFSILENTTFLSGDILNILSLGDRSVSSYDVFREDNFSESLSDVFGEKRYANIYCDGRIYRQQIDDENSAKITALKCDKAVALSDLSVRIVRHARLFRGFEPVQVPIAVLAMSSLTATFLFYYIIVARSFFPVARHALNHYSDDADVIFNRWMFSITLFISIIVLSPLFLIYMIFL